MNFFLTTPLHIAYISRVSFKCMLIFIKKIVVLSSNEEDIGLFFKSKWEKKKKKLFQKL
jgi:hypothetical protein